MSSASAVPSAFARGSTNRLTAHDLGRFGGGSLLDALGRAVCAAGCLSRKELFEAWEVARRVRRRFRGGRVVDLAGGHGLLAHALLLLDDSSSMALVVDPSVPGSAAALHDALCRAWPRLRGRVRYVEEGVEQTGLTAEDLAVSCHACGELTDLVLAVAERGRARVAVLPCCHRTTPALDSRFRAWMDPALAIDVERTYWLASRGYAVWTQRIPADITPKNRLLLGMPGPVGLGHAITAPPSNLRPHS